MDGVGKEKGGEWDERALRVEETRIARCKETVKARQRQGRKR